MRKIDWYKIKAGMKFYDEMEDRYITVLNISSKVAECNEVTFEVDDFNGDEEVNVESRLFTLQELSHFTYLGEVR